MQFGLKPLHNPQDLFAIGDVHGEAEKLRRILALITPFCGPDTHIVFVGDLFDVGPDVVGVWEILMDLIVRGFKVFFIAGNHEEMFMDYLKQRPTGWHEIWPEKYGLVAVEQYRKTWGLLKITPEILTLELQKRGYWKIIESLIRYYESPEVIITHAPLDRTVVEMHGGLDEERISARECLLDRMEWDLRWGQTDEKSKHTREIPEIPKYLINGHCRLHHHFARQYSSRVFLDAGCGYRPESPLFAIHYPSKRLISSESDPGHVERALYKKSRGRP